MITLYKGDPRAVVLSQSNRHCEDVRTAQKDTSKSTYFPFGLGIYEQVVDDKGRSKRGKLLPLYYVSHEAACVRSPGRHALNAAGVREGWYVVADAGVTFEVAITCMNEKTLSYKDDTGKSYNTIRATLFVDGTETSHIYDVDSESYRYEYTCKGPEPGTAGQLSAFQFQKAPLTDDMRDEDINSQVGMIAIKVERGNSIQHVYSDSLLFRDDDDDSASSGEEWHPLRNGLSTKRSNNKRKRRRPLKKVRFSTGIAAGALLDSSKIHEKAAAKDGKSIRVGTSTKVVKEPVGRAKGGGPEESLMHSPTMWNEAKVIVFVRERAWMQSRRILDDNGEACTHEKYEQLLRDASAEQTADFRRRQAKEEVSLDSGNETVKDYIDLTV